MKKLLFISLLALCQSAQSQLVFTEQNAMWQPGDDVIWHISDLANFPKVNFTGNNNNWDFTGLATTPSYDIHMSYPAPLSVECFPNYDIDDFPMLFIYDSDVAPDTGIWYINLSAEELRIEGYECTPDYAPLKFFEFPFNYGDSDTTTYGPTSDMLVTRINTYVAAGSLTMPSGQYFSQCALVNISEESISDYLFMVEVDGRMQPAIYLGFEDMEIYEIEYVTKVNEAMASNNLSLLRQQNNKFILQGTATHKFDITTYDISGNLIHSKSNDATLDLENLSHGGYLINVKMDNGSVETFKVVI